MTKKGLIIESATAIGAMDFL